MTTRLSVKRSVLFALTGAMLFSGLLFADDQPAKTTEPSAPVSKKPEKAAKKAKLTEQETKVLEFVRTNHDELRPLLDGLKDNSPAEYTAALTELSRAIDRLERVKGMSGDRYETQLADWRKASRIKLLAARLAVDKDPQAIEAELRTAIRERLEARLVAEKAERDRLQVRIQKLNESIDELSANTDSMMEKELTQLRSAARPKGGKKAKAATTEPAKQGDKE